MGLFQSRYKKILKFLQDAEVIFTERTLKINKETEIKIVFIKQIVDTDGLSEYVIKPLIIYGNESEPLNADKVTNCILYAYDTEIDDNDKKILDYILDGMVIILFSNDKSYLVVNLKKIEHRSIPIPEITYTIRGPRDCFTENIDINLSLIRYRLKDPKLRIEMLTVGKRSKTSVAVIYIEDIANPQIVSEIKKKINAISIDIIWGTGELEALLQNNQNIFTQFGTTERSDWACEAITEGKVVIMADGGGIILMAPHTFTESLIACDDRYDNKFFGLFSRIIRYLSVIITLCSSATYVALVSYRTDILPANFIIRIAQMRQTVIFPAFLDVLIIEFLVELIREAMIRVPTKIGPAIGIVGAIVIGQAATAAGLFSPLLLIIAAVSLMASFAIANYFAAHPFRILKFFVIISASLLGFYGIVLALTVIMINMVSINSYGVPYMAPLAPFNLYDTIRTFFFNRAHSAKRIKYQKNVDNTRSDQKKLSAKRSNRMIKLFKRNNN